MYVGKAGLWVGGNWARRDRVYLGRLRDHLAAVPSDIPFHTVAVYAGAAAFVLGGLMLQLEFTAAGGAFIVSVLYLIFAALWAKRIIGFPQIFGTWSGCAEELALVIAGLVVFASGPARNPAAIVTVGRNCLWRLRRPVRRRPFRLPQRDRGLHSEVDSVQSPLLGVRDGRRACGRRPRAHLGRFRAPRRASVDAHVRRVRCSRLGTAGDCATPRPHRLGRQLREPRPRRCGVGHCRAIAKTKAAGAAD